MRLLLLPVLIVLACHAAGPTGPLAHPDRTAGRPSLYVLRSVAGQPLPATLVANEHVTLVVVADTIRIDRGGTGTQVALQSVDGQVFRSDSPFTYELTMGRIVIALECNDVLIRSCIAPPHYTGELTPSHLILETTALHYRVPLRYERIAPGN